MTNNYSFPTELIVVGYDPTLYITTEGQGFVDLTVRIFEPRFRGAPRDFVLSINTQDGTAGKQYGSTLNNDSDSYGLYSSHTLGTKFNFDSCQFHL